MTIEVWISAEACAPAGLVCAARSVDRSDSAIVSVGISTEKGLILGRGCTKRSRPRKNSFEESDRLSWRIFFRRRNGVSALRFRIWLGNLPAEKWRHQPNALVSLGQSVVTGFEDLKIQDIVFSEDHAVILDIRADGSIIRAGLK